MITFAELKNTYNLSDPELIAELSSLGFNSSQTDLDIIIDENSDRIITHLEGIAATFNATFSAPISSYPDLDTFKLKKHICEIGLDPSATTFDESSRQKITNYLDRLYHPLMQLFELSVAEYDLTLDRVIAALPEGIDVDNINANEIPNETITAIEDNIVKQNDPLMLIFSEQISLYNLDRKQLQQTISQHKRDFNIDNFEEREIIIKYLDRTYHPLMKVFQPAVSKYDLSLNQLQTEIAKLNITIDENNVNPSISKLVNDTLERSYDPLLLKFPSLVTEYDLSKKQLKLAVTQVAPDLDLDLATPETLEQLRIKLERKFHPFGYLADKYNLTLEQIKLDLAEISDDEATSAASILEQRYNPLWYSSESIDEYAQSGAVQQSKNLRAIKQQIDHRQMVQFAQAYDAYTGQYLRELRDSGTVKVIATDAVDAVLGKFDPQENKARLIRRLQMLNSPAPNTLPPSDPSSNKSLNPS